MNIRITLPLGLAVSLSACAPQPSAPSVAQQAAPIVAGERAAADELLSTVALVDPGSGGFFCTGTLVAPTVVITAAHCMVREDQSGWVGPDELAVAAGLLLTPAPAAQRLAVARLAVHPGYAHFDEGDGLDPSGLGRLDDIAVLVLEQPVVAQAPTPILPVALLDGLVPGLDLVISGYGITDLNEANDEAGRLHIGSTRLVRRSGHELLAGGPGVADTCNGDSGGPMYWTVDGQRYLVGATSRSAHDASAMCGDRGLYALVPAYAGWIDEVVADGPAAHAAPPPVGDAPQGEGEGEWAEGEWADDGEPDADVCAEEDWYGDGECDDFCDAPDPDCAGEPEGETPEDAEPEDAEPEDAEPEDAEPEGAEPEGAEPEDAPEPAEGSAEDQAEAGCSATPAGGAPGASALMLLALLGLRRRSPRVAR
jgi:uncharacterized protein (TIGR03382 family)